MSELVWKTDMPTKEGWYFCRYTGYNSRTERLQVVKLSYPGRSPETFHGFLPTDRLAIETMDRDGRIMWQENRYHPDCYPVYWAGPIQEPQEASS